MLSLELKIKINEIVVNWIQLNHSEIMQQLIKDTVFTHSEDINEYIVYELFNSEKRSFGKYLKQNGAIKKKDIVQIKIYAIQWFNKNMLISLDERINNFEFLGKQLGYILLREKTEFIIQVFNSTSCSCVLK
jgi:hypothetical protein